MQSLDKIQVYMQSPTSPETAIIRKIIAAEPKDAGAVDTGAYEHKGGAVVVASWLHSALRRPQRNQLQRQRKRGLPSPLLAIFYGVHFFIGLEAPKLQQIYHKKRRSKEEFRTLRTGMPLPEM